MPDVNSCAEPTFYKILGLTGHPSSDPFQQDVKAAYHRALLLYHPDRINAHLATEQQTHREHEDRYTVDQITKAYNTLSKPVTRAAYDKELDLSNRRSRKLIGNKFHNGVEILDLEDLVYDDTTNVWSRGCRCGDSHGYVLTEMDLERQSRDGEIFVVCRGCSLWIKVLFGTMEGNVEAEEAGAKEEQQTGTAGFG